ETHLRRSSPLSVPVMAAPNLSSSSEPHVEVRDVYKSFDSRRVLSAIDITFLRGEISVIIGGSGTGKTTLLRLLIGLEKPDRGSILIAGQDIVPLSDREMNRVRRKFGMVFQYAALLDSMTVLENVAFPLREHTSLGEREIRERVRAKLSDLGLNDVEHQ